MFQVVLTQHGRPTSHAVGSPPTTFAYKADAKAKAQRMNKLLSPGEKGHYGLRYKIIDIK